MVFLWFSYGFLEIPGKILVNPTSMSPEKKGPFQRSAFDKIDRGTAEGLGCHDIEREADVDQAHDDHDGIAYGISN